VFGVRIEKKEKTDKIVSISAVIEVNSSMRLLLDLLPMCNEVIMNRQKPKRFADVLRMCCEVLFAKGYLFFWDLNLILDYFLFFRKK
jgi:hypothetical protein